MASDKQKIIIAVSLLISFLFYSFFIYSSLPVKNYSINKEISKGKLVWQQYNCTACHQVYGLGGYLGPDLTNVYSIRGKDYIKALLSYGTASMPNFHLSEQEKNALVAYFNNIDASGKSDPRSFIINTDGTIEQ
jgi:nitric oxide reductase subunit C